MRMQSIAQILNENQLGKNKEGKIFQAEIYHINLFPGLEINLCAICVISRHYIESA